MFNLEKLMETYIDQVSNQFQECIYKVLKQLHHLVGVDIDILKEHNSEELLADMFRRGYHVETVTDHWKDEHQTVYYHLKCNDDIVVSGRIIWQLEGYHTHFFANFGKHIDGHWKDISELHLQPLL